MPRSACSIAWCSTRARRRSTTSTTAAAAIVRTCAAASRTRASSTSPTAPTAGRARSRATPRSRRGRAASPGRCSASPRSSSSSEIVPDDALQPSGGRAAVEAMMLEAARATCDHYIDIAGRRRRSVLGRRRPGTRGARRLGRSLRPIRSTITSRSTARRPRSRRRGCLRLGHLLEARASPPQTPTSRPACASSTRCSTRPGRT